VNVNIIAKLKVRVNRENKNLISAINLGSIAMTLQEEQVSFIPPPVAKVANASGSATSK
jgi:hypothetical protein